MLRSLSVMMGLALLPAVGTARAAAYSLPFNLQNVSNKSLLVGNKDLSLSALSPAQRAALSQQGFVISPAGQQWRQFHQVYEATRYAEQPVFATTDSALHIYHLVFDKLLRDLERESLAPTLKTLLARLVPQAQAQARALGGTPLAPNAVQALAYLATAQRLTDPAAKVPAEVQAAVQAQLKLVAAQQGIGPSPIFTAPDFSEDYSQYRPRGHYTRSAQLKQYFQAMTWLGRINLRVKDASETRTAALLARLLSQDATASKLWNRIYQPTTLLIGASDDLNFTQYAAALKPVVGSDIRALADDRKLSALQAALAALPPPRVNSVFVVARPGEGVDVRQRDTLGFRLMGQRFTLDGAALQQLVYREVGTQDHPRTLPRGLDVMAALGSPAARNELSRLGDFSFKNFAAQLDKVTRQFFQLTPTDWNANLYSGWLYTLQGLARPEARDARFPAFMRTPAWSRKELLTALSSWTELRHDTLLYAKQVMAEMGGGEEPEHPRGYVEPNLQVWGRLLDLGDRTRTVLTSQNILSERTANNLESLQSMLTFLQSVSRRELSGAKISRDEYDRIHFYGGWLEELTTASTDPEGGDDGGTPQFSEPPYAAVVADVATDAGNGVALEEATGTVQELYALVPDGKGGTQIARGGVYSQYEFTVPLAGRLTDEAWRAQLKAGRLPPLHPWLQGVVVK
ncbi:hypothetical protein DKM44_05140 [Deinococcus irradiatisoli]|uniref:DUF3160 domain-containing protein n=1 Tax=Deinococcus irradiatisoli TaxID=2202254 RepID=A0A2Z3JNB2_9DEIO|nr:DUF3160 domain-containing protein [Deinococcus irradiatisoli]AWN22694.1 hypothetical protein DKM44_05140 [Deinococcus irradiatisoli]